MENWFVMDDIKHFGRIIFDELIAIFLLTPSTKSDPSKFNFHVELILLGIDMQTAH